ncbi:MAG: O-methyltransferase [Chloroflexota bacterium]
MPEDLRTRFDTYIGELFLQEDPVLEAIRTSPLRHNMPQINVQPYEGYLLGWLTRLAQVRTAVEIGTLAGYSTAWIARALPADGRIYTIEKSSKHVRVARENMETAGLAPKVEVVQGEALPILEQLSSRGPFDLVFIDADKTSYPDYLTWAVDNLRLGGMVAAHNAYRDGRIMQPEDEADHAMVHFNQLLANNPRLDSIIIPMGDGLAAAIKRSN